MKCVNWERNGNFSLMPVHYRGIEIAQNGSITYLHEIKLCFTLADNVNANTTDMSSF